MNVQSLTHPTERPPNRYDSLGLHGHPHAPFRPNGGNRSTANGPGASVVHGNVHIRSVSYGGVRSDYENHPPLTNIHSGSSGQKRQRTNSWDDELSPPSSPDGLPAQHRRSASLTTSSEPLNPIPASAVAGLADQFQLDHAKRTLLFSFHKVRFILSLLIAFLTHTSVLRV